MCHWHCVWTAVQCLSGVLVPETAGLRRPSFITQKSLANPAGLVFRLRLFGPAQDFGTLCLRHANANIRSTILFRVYVWSCHSGISVVAETFSINRNHGCIIGTQLLSFGCPVVVRVLAGEVERPVSKCGSVPRPTPPDVFSEDKSQ